MSNGNSQQQGEDGDRFSMLTDDIILSILGRLDVITAARTCVLSLLLRELAIDVDNFLPIPHPNPIETQHVEAAMGSIVEALRSFLATHHTEATTISTLQLTLYLVGSHSDAIGPTLCEAIDSGIVQDLNLAVLDDKDPDVPCTDEDMLQQARSVDGFFSAYPSVRHCLTRLSLYNVRFAEWDMNHVLFDCCKQLRHLYLSNCHAGALTWKIHAPDSNLTVLELDICFLVKIEVLQLPKLERLNWGGWLCKDIPLLLGDVPSLKELYLMSGAPVFYQGFKLSEALVGSTAIQDLTVSFQGEKIWIKPEGRELCTTFSKLKKLSLHDIFVEFDLLWTMVLLEAMPSVEVFDIEIWDGNTHA